MNLVTKKTDTTKIKTPRTVVCYKKGVSGAPPSSPRKISKKLKKISYEPRRNFLQPQIVKNLLPKWSVLVRIFYNNNSIFFFFLLLSNATYSTYATYSTSLILRSFGGRPRPVGFRVFVSAGALGVDHSINDSLSRAATQDTNRFASTSCRQLVAPSPLLLPLASFTQPE
jgi:hypothetical protein